MGFGIWNSCNSDRPIWSHTQHHNFFLEFTVFNDSEIKSTNKKEAVNGQSFCLKNDSND